MTSVIAAEVSTQTLFVAWRDAADSLIHPVGRLTLDSATGTFEFRYLSNVKQLERFSSLPGFPNLETVYQSRELFPLFEVRIMSRRRPDYESYLGSLGLDPGEHDPFVLLARSEGWKSTDRLEVFAPPRLLEDGETGSALFFLRGLRYYDGAEQHIDGLAVGQMLSLLPDRDNPVNSLAVQVLDGDQMLGHVPDYLADYVHEVWDQRGPGSVRVYVEHLNPDSSGSHMRLLCRLESCWPEGYEPFSDARFLPLIEY